MKTQNSFYLYLQKRLLESADKDNNINYKEAGKILMNVRIPKSFVPILIKELNHWGLIKRDMGKIEVINIKESNKIVIDWKYDRRIVRY